MRFRMALLIMLGLLAAVWLTGCGARDDAAAKTAEHVVDQEQKLKLLNDAADAMYTLLKQGKIVEARDELLRFEDELTTIPYNGITSADGVRALTQAVYDAKLAFNRVSFSMNEGMRTSLTLRLAADSLSHPHQPMWHQYYNVLREDTDHLQDSAAKGDQSAFADGLAAMKAHYELIRPSAIINRGMEPVVQADSLFTHAGKAAQAGSFDSPGALETAEHFREVWETLFGRKDQNAYAPLGDEPSDAWPAMILCLIALVLGFVGWQKYKYQPAYSVISPRKDREE